MWKEMSTDKILYRKDVPSLHPSLFLFDFPAIIRKMKHKNSWSTGDLDTKILLKTPARQIVLAALHEGTEIRSFQSNESVTFQIIEGRMRFHTRKGTVNLEKDQMLNLSENINYRLTASEETVLLLTITSGSVQLSEN
jgi:mannose-6-phosphate isomerase-like protein (cupin superfamily)